VTDLIEAGKWIFSNAPHAIGWIAAAILGRLLYLLAVRYAEVLPKTGEGAEGVAAALESMEAHITAALSRIHSRLDELEQQIAENGKRTDNRHARDGE